MTDELVIERDGVRLAVEDTGERPGDRPPVVLLHGLTATRRYVVMGSRLLERAGHRVIAYDARGHGRSWPAPDPAAYGYEKLVSDLEAVLDGLGIERAVLAGASMGAHTLLSFALRKGERIAGLVVITPAYAGSSNLGDRDFDRWDALAAGLRARGVDGFLEAYGTPRVPPALRDTVLKVIRQRLALHEHPEAVADALQTVPRSRPFGEVAELGAIEVPVAVVASNDVADPEHPRAVGEAYAAAIPGARLVTDPEDRGTAGGGSISPIAWQGSRLSHVIAEVAQAGRHRA